MRPPRRSGYSGRRWWVLAMAAGGVALATPPARAQACLPFAVGETLRYSLRIGFGIRVGRGELSVADGDSVRGAVAMRFRFDVEGGAGPIRASQHSVSWVDPHTLATFRFVKHERSPVMNGDDSVEVFPREKRWAAAKGAIGYTPNELPLDELSFLYFVRTLPLGADSSWTFARHYDPARSPTLVRVLGHETMKVEAGTFETWKVELKVRDPAHFRGMGRMILHITDDAQRIPIRIETDMREAGSTVMELASRTPAAACVAREGSPDRGVPPTAQRFGRLPDAP